MKFAFTFTVSIFNKTVTLWLESKGIYGERLEDGEKRPFPHPLNETNGLVPWLGEGMLFNLLGGTAIVDKSLGTMQGVEKQVPYATTQEHENQFG